MSGRNGGKKRIFSLRTAVLALAAVLLGLNIYRWNTESLLGEQMPMPLGFGMSVVLSGSMEPTLSVDDLVFIRQTEDVAVGDIVVFRAGGALVIHRVVAVEGQEIVTKGDANNMADAPIRKEDVKGVLALAVPGVGGAVRVLKTPPVTVAVLVVAVALMERSFRREKEKDNEELDDIKREIQQLLRELKDE